MGVKESLKKISFEEAKNMTRDYEYSLIYEISEMIFDKTEVISEIHWDEVQEAYFFDENSQLHIYATDDKMDATLYRETEDVNFVERSYELTEKFKRLGSFILERDYLEFDDDGQAYVAYKRLVSVS